MSDQAKFIGVVCGLKSEAGAVREAVDASKLKIGVSGANAARAETIAREFCEAGACAIVSVGVSGGLAPHLISGDLIIGETIVGDDGGLYEADGYLLGALPSFSSTSAAALKATKGRLFGANDIIDSAEKKAALFHNHNCLAVDMESHGVARAAKAAGAPFVAFRAIADPAARALPPAAMKAIAPDGSVRALATLGQALRDPKQLLALRKLGADNAAAMKTLRRDLGPLFGGLFLSLDL